MLIKQKVSQRGVLSFGNAAPLSLVMATALSGGLAFNTVAQATTSINDQPVVGQQLHTATQALIREQGYLDADAFYTMVSKPQAQRTFTVNTVSSPSAAQGFIPGFLTPTHSVNDLARGDYNLPLYQCLRRVYSDRTLLGQIDNIACADAGLDSLAGLEGMDQLRHLDLQNSINSPTPNTFTDLNPLIGDDGRPVSQVLTSLNLSGSDLSLNSLLFSSLSQELYQFQALRHLSLANSKLQRLPEFLGFGGSGLALQSLDLRGNALESLDGLTAIRAINYLWLDHNPLGNTILEHDSPLSAFPHMISLSLRDVGLTNQVQGVGLPGEVGFLDLRDNQAMAQLRLAPTTVSFEDNAPNIVFTLDLRNNARMSCRNLDTTEVWFAGQAQTDYCVGDPLLGEECFLAPSSVQRPQVCTPEAPVKFVVNEGRESGSYSVSWREVPPRWNVNLFKVWYLSDQGGMAQSILIRDEQRGAHSFSLPVLSSGRYLFALQACNDTDGEFCGPLSPYQRSVARTPLKRHAMPLGKP